MEKEPASSPRVRSPIEQSIHDLRNGMNTLLMNAAVLSSRADAFPAELRPFLDQLSKSGRICSEELSRLFSLVDARKP